MTTLRHRVLDGQGKPVEGRVATVAAYHPEQARSGAYQRAKAVTAITGADGWLTWTLPSVTGGGHADPVYVVTGIELEQVLVSVPRAVSTATVTETRTGTLPLPADAESSRDLVTENELSARLAGIAALSSAFMPGRVLNKDGSVNTQKRLSVKLTADGNDIEDIIIEAAG